MTVKLAILKSGEDIISDIKEMVIEDRIVGYFFYKPCAIKMKHPQGIIEDQDKSFQVSLFPWIPISKDLTIPVPSDWIITIVEPIDKLSEMYKNQVLENDSTDSVDTSNEQSDPGLSD